MSRLCHRGSMLVFAVLLLTAQGRSFAGDPGGLSEDQIKAGFLFNFMRFVEWPSSAFASPAAPLIACIAGETPVTRMLTSAAAGKDISGHPIEVRHLATGADPRSCHLLFIDVTAADRQHALLTRLNGANTLTVGETSGFAQRGGIINFFDQDNRVKLELNLQTANHAGLKISAKLIAVSRLIGDSHATGSN